MFVEKKLHEDSAYEAYRETWLFLGPDGKLYEWTLGQVYNFFFAHEKPKS